MRNSVILILTILIVSCGRQGTDSAVETDQISTNIGAGEKLIYYTCPMESHSHIHQEGSGVCSECGMKLVPAVITSYDKMEFYGCPMQTHSHIRQTEPGKCSECGMTLMPMRLVLSDQP